MLVDRNHELILFPESGRRRGRAGVRSQLQARGPRDVAPREAHLVAAGCDSPALEGPEHVKARHVRDRLVTQVPGDAIVTRLDLEHVCRIRVLRARVVPNHVALPVEKLERDRCRIRHLRDVEVDDRTIGRVLAHVTATAKPTAPSNAVRGARVEQVQLRLGDIRVHLLERRQIVQNPEGATLGRGHEIVVLRLDLEVGNRCQRHVELQRLPVITIVPRDVESGFRPRVQQPAADVVLPHDPDVRLRRDALDNVLPTLAVVVGLVDVRAKVVELVPGVRDVRGRGIVRGDVDCVHHPLTHASRRHVGPRGASVLRHVHEPVVAPHPDGLGIVRRLGHVHDRVVDLTTGPLVGDGAAARALLLVLVAREIVADLRPRVAPVRRLEEHVARVVDDVRVVLRDHDRGVPVEAVLHVARGERGWKHRIRHDVAHCRGALVPLRDLAHVAAAVVQHRVVGVEHHVGGLAPGHRVPVLPANATGRPARDGDGAVVLLAAIDVVRETVIGVHAVELGCRLVLLGGPGLTAVQRDVRAAVVRVDQVVAVGRIDPLIVVVAVRRTHAGKCLAAVNRFHCRGAQHPYHVGVLRVREHLGVVPGPVPDPPRLVDHLPVLATILRAVQPTAWIGFEHDVHSVGVGGYGYAGLANELGKPLGELLPGTAAVRGFPDPAPGAAASHLPRLPQVVPEGSVENARIVGVDREVARSGGLADVEHSVPRVSAVRRAVDPAVLGGPVRRALSGDVDEVRIPRVNADA